MHSETERLQLDSFLAITQNDSSLLRQIFSILIDDLDHFLRMILHAETASNAETFRQTTHKILPGLKMMGQQQMVSAIEAYKKILVDPVSDSPQQKADLLLFIINKTNHINQELKQILADL